MTDNTNIEALLGSWDDIEFKKSSGEELTAIEQFIYDNEPAVYTEFRAELKDMVQEAFDLGRRAALSNAEPVGEVGAMPGTEGFTMACFHAKDIPIGTKLFLHPSVPAPQWLPIESAPKDGTRVILSWSNNVIIGFYLDNSDKRTPWSGWRPTSMEPFPLGQPMAYMPMPLPLTNTEEQG